jgi:hypothetical protein
MQRRSPGLEAGAVPAHGDFAQGCAGQEWSMPGAVRATFGVCLVVLLTGCSQVEQPRQWVRSTSAATYDKIGMTGKALGAPWGAPRSDVPRDPDSVTISRVFGPNPVVDPLRSEGGNVWPQPEPPRATLANPDAALRGIPNYRPPGGPSLSPAGVTGMSIAPEPRQRSRGSSTPPPPPDPNDWRRDERRPMSALPPPGLDDPPPRRADGRMLNTPGGVAVSGPGTDRVGTYVAPGGAAGTAIRDANGTTTLVGPGGQITTVPSPR